MFRRSCQLLILLLAFGAAACSPAQTGLPARAAALATPSPPAPATLPPTPTGAATPLPHDPPQNCPVTRPPDPPFTPPAPYPPTAPEASFWFGSSRLWASLPQDGVWSQLPHNPGGYTQKIPFWSETYFWKDEPEPRLTLEGRRLDGPAPRIDPQTATNAFTQEYLSMMMSGVDFPTLGCWELTGRYAGQALTFVVWVAP